MKKSAFLFAGAAIVGAALLGIHAHKQATTSASLAQNVSTDAPCGGDPECIEGMCNDGGDEDNDGLVDCADPDCSRTPVCGYFEQTELTWECGNGTCETPAEDCNECPGDCNCDPEDIEGACTDGGDEDNDGLVDCADPNCASDPACNIPESCAGGVDEDHDGWVDCLDSECMSDPECIEAMCDDGGDEDGDGATDCADSDCAADPVCQATANLMQNLWEFLNGMLKGGS